jgi:hypothetical protein
LEERRRRGWKTRQGKMEKRRGIDGKMKGCDEIERE